MPGALYNPDNVKVGLAVMYLQPWVFGAVEPLPATSSVLFDDTNWVGATPVWQKAGATHEGFKINVDVSTTQITIEEQSLPTAETVETKGIAIEAALAEDTINTIQLAWGGGTITTTAAATGSQGKKEMSLTDDIDYWTVALEMENVFGLARRIYIPKMSLVGSGDTAFRRAADKRTYPVRFSSVCAPSDVDILEITAAALV